MIAAAHEIAGGPHPAWIDIGHRYQASFEQRGNLMGIDLVVLAFAAVNGPHVEGMVQDERDLFILTEIGQPVPGKHAFGGNHKIIAERFDCPQKCSGLVRMLRCRTISPSRLRMQRYILLVCRSIPQ